MVNDSDSLLPLCGQDWRGSLTAVTRCASMPSDSFRLPVSPPESVSPEDHVMRDFTPGRQQELRAIEDAIHGAPDAFVRATEFAGFKLEELCVAVSAGLWTRLSQIHAQQERKRCIYTTDYPGVCSGGWSIARIE